MLTFNMEHGFIEAIVRGFTLKLINKQQYENFCQCETLEDLKVQLNSTEYFEAIHTLSPPITTSNIGEALLKAFVKEYKYLQEHSTGMVAKFLKFMTIEYQIDNVVTILTGMLHEEIGSEELAERCHPLGLFEALPALTISRNVTELYDTALAETALGPYFKRCLSAQDLDAFNLDIIKNTLMKAYLEDFYGWVKGGECDDSTRDQLGSILEFEADRRTINICVNSVGSSIDKENVLTLLPNFGSLWKDGVAIKMSKCDDLQTIKNIIEQEAPIYRPVMEIVMSSQSHKDAIPSGDGGFGGAVGGQSMEEFFFAKEVDFCSEAIFSQFSLCPFYAWIKLKEQEIRNIVWIAECISQDQRENIHQFIPIQA